MCSLKDSQNFIQSLPLHTSWLFSVHLNEDIRDIEKHDGIYLFTFVVDERLRLFYIDQPFLLYTQGLH